MCNVRLAWIFWCGRVSTANGNNQLREYKFVSRVMDNISFAQLHLESSLGDNDLSVELDSETVADLASMGGCCSAMKKGLNMVSSAYLTMAL